ncbi:hypothetical protein [Yoonia sp. 208BN28-4]|uniref:hypothetical protein n=1 Tax=Yoonia sp. 208BN28-4 TaxID=3126505 RepID=UPI0030A3C4E8
MTVPAMPSIDRDGRLRPEPAKPGWKDRFIDHMGTASLGSDMPSLRLASHIAKPDDDTTVGLKQKLREFALGQRMLNGRLRTEKELKRHLWRNSFAMFLAMPPIGVLVLVVNALLGPRLYFTRGALMFVLAIWMMIVLTAPYMFGELLPEEYIYVSDGTTSFSAPAISDLMKPVDLMAD